MVIHKIYEFQNWISEITGHMINFIQVSLIYFTHWAGSNDFIRSFMFKSLPQLPISANFEHGLLIIVTPSFGSNYCHFYLSTYSWITARIFLIYWQFLWIFLYLHWGIIVFFFLFCLFFTPRFGFCFLNPYTYLCIYWPFNNLFANEQNFVIHFVEIFNF